MLHIMLSNGEKKAKQAELFEFQYSNSVLPRGFPDTGFRKDGSRNNFRHPIEEVCYYPIEHFNHEGELLKDPAVEMARET